MSLVNYAATGANALKNWELITKPCPTKLTKKDFWPWIQFLRLQVKNFEWEELLTIPVTQGGTAGILQNENDEDQENEDPNLPPQPTINLVERFHQVTLDQVKQTRDARVAAGDDTLKIKTKALYTWLTYSCDRELQRVLANNHTMLDGDSVLVWKLLNIKCTRQTDSAMETVSANIHNCRLDKYARDVGKCLDYLQDQLNVLYSGSINFYSIERKIFKIMVKAEHEEFRSHVQSLMTLHEHKQLTISTEEIMTSFEDKWSEIEKDIKPSASEKKLQETIMSLQAKVASLERKSGQIKTNGKFKKRRLDTVPPKPGEKWTKIIKNKKFHWCKFCQFWTCNPKHTTDSYSKNPKNEFKSQVNFALYDDAEEFESVRPFFQMETELLPASIADFGSPSSLPT